MIVNGTWNKDSDIQSFDFLRGRKICHFRTLGTKDLETSFQISVGGDQENSHFELRRQDSTALISGSDTTAVLRVRVRP